MKKQLKLLIPLMIISVIVISGTLILFATKNDTGQSQNETEVPTLTTETTEETENLTTPIVDDENTQKHQHLSEHQDNQEDNKEEIQNFNPVASDGTPFKDLSGKELTSGHYNLDFYNHTLSPADDPYVHLINNRIKDLYGKNEFVEGETLLWEKKYKELDPFAISFTQSGLKIDDLQINIDKSYDATAFPNYFVQNGETSYLNFKKMYQTDSEISLDQTIKLSDYVSVFCNFTFDNALRDDKVVEEDKKTLTEHEIKLFDSHFVKTTLRIDNNGSDEIVNEIKNLYKGDGLSLGCTARQVKEVFGEPTKDSTESFDANYHVMSHYVYETEKTRIMLSFIRENEEVDLDDAVLYSIEWADKHEEFLTSLQRIA